MTGSEEIRLMVQVRKRAFHPPDTDNEAGAQALGPVPASLRVVETLPLPPPAALPALTRREL